MLKGDLFNVDDKKIKDISYYFISWILIFIIFTFFFNKYGNGVSNTTDIKYRHIILMQHIMSSTSVHTGI